MENKSVEQAAEEYADKQTFTFTDKILAIHAKEICKRDFIAGHTYAQKGEEWISEKPKFTEECTFITATKYTRNDEPLEWNYSVWQIKKLDGEDADGNYGWYFGLLNGDGEEWGDLDDLHADKYLIIKPPSSTKQEEAK